MKKIISILVLLLFTGAISLVKAQDVITKKDGSEIRAKVTEVNVNEVKYKLFDNQNGQTISLPKSEIFMIVYENGTKDVFGVDSAPARTQAPGQPPFQTPVAAQQSGGYGYQDTAPVQGYGHRQLVNYKKGYVGVSLAGSSPTKDGDYASAGVQVNINAGYLFSKNVGIASSIFANTYDAKKYDGKTVGLTGVLVGPLFSFGSEPRLIEYDIRPSMGFLSIGVTTGDTEWTSDDMALAVGLGFSVRWNVSNVISLTGNLDYLNQGEFKDTDWLLSSVGIGIGVNYRF
ncbi:MAG: porin family protein [Tannerella sp.]|jgi:hypothetical protein|nr:porin family protein [Tannerella sp.]